MEERELDKEERIVNVEDLKTSNLEQLKSVREYLLHHNLDLLEQTSNSTETKGHQKTLGSGKLTGGLNMYPEYDEKKAGMTNIILLSLITFISECIFLFISFNMFK